LLKRDQLPHLLLITWTEKTAVEHKDQRITIQEPQALVEETGLCELRETHHLILMIGQSNVWKMVVHLKMSCHKCVLLEDQIARKPFPGYFAKAWRLVSPRH